MFEGQAELGDEHRSQYTLQHFRQYWRHHRDISPANTIYGEKHSLRSSETRKRATIGGGGAYRRGGWQKFGANGGCIEGSKLIDRDQSVRN